MSTLTSDQALFFRDHMLGSLKSEHQVTRRVIEAIPRDQGDYRPDAIVKSAIDLAWHIAGAEHRFMDAVVNGAFDFTGTGRPAELNDSARLASWYGETFQRDVERLSSVPADRLVQIVDFRGLF